ncbi:MAG: NADH-quinone oxidoreductase subunit J [Chloroflexi bacterium]|nr:NADH-quinone oxidoreductase subunit J [Chloroflexota bacterium]
MTLQQILFIIFGAITLGAAFMVVTRKNVFHAALFMILSFFGVAGLYVLLEAPFLAGAQLFIYVGGISILIIFAIMLTRDMMNPDLVGSNQQWIAAALVALALGAVLVWTVTSYNGWASAAPGEVPEATSIITLGTVLVDAEGLALPFEVASVLLLVALIGAVTIARER